MKLTDAQKNVLALLSSRNLVRRDIRRGTYLAMIQRMLNAGLIKYTTKPNWRDSFYSITPAGRAALRMHAARNGQ